MRGLTRLPGALWCAALVAIIWSIGGAQGLCQPAGSLQAERLFREGRVHMVAGHPERACPMFARSLQMTPTLGTRLNLALCEAALGRTVAAMIHLEQFLVEATAGDPRRPLALQQLRAMRARVAQVTFRASRPAPVDGQVRLDGRTLSPEQLLTPQRLDAGLHRLEVEAGGRVLVRYEFQLAPGESVVLPLPWHAEGASRSAPVGLSQATAAPTQPRRAVASAGRSHWRGESRGRRRRAWLLTVGAVAAATLALGAASGIVALREARVVRDECRDSTDCSPRGTSAARIGRWAAPLSTAAFVVGGTAAATTFSLWLSARPSQNGASATVGLRARF